MVHGSVYDLLGGLETSQPTVVSLRSCVRGNRIVKRATASSVPQCTHRQDAKRQLGWLGRYAALLLLTCSPGALV